MTTTPINIVKFCDLQGVADIDRVALVKRHRNTEPKLYGEWYDELKSDYAIGEKKEFKKSSKKVEKVEEEVEQEMPKPEAKKPATTNKPAATPKKTSNSK